MLALPPVIEGSAVMATENQCEDYARDCMRLAGLTKDEYIRDQLLNMAREWISAAPSQPPKRVEQTARH